MDIQVFYCAEAEAARIYALYTPANDPNAPANDATLGPQLSPNRAHACQWHVPLECPC